MPLTAKQQRFVEEYGKDANATQAAIRAGYHAKMAAKLVAKGSIQEAIAANRRERAERINLDADAVVQAFHELYLRALQAEDLSTAARCLENLGKHTGAFAAHNSQKQRHMDPEELKKRLEEKGFDFSRTHDRSRN